MSQRRYIIKQELPINRQIKEKEVQVIDENGEKIGILPINEAISKGKVMRRHVILTENGYEVPYSELYTTREDEGPTGVDYSELKVGEYVSNYPVQYDNVPTSNGTNHIPTDEYKNRWRILSIDEENKIAKPKKQKANGKTKPETKKTA